MTPEVVVRSDFAPGQGVQQLQLPISETPIFMGPADGVIRTAEVPRYDEMRGFVFQRLGWNPADFDVYRLRVDYPVLSTAMALSFKLA